MYLLHFSLNYAKSHCNISLKVIENCILFRYNVDQKVSDFCLKYQSSIPIKIKSCPPKRGNALSLFCDKQRDSTILKQMIPIFNLSSFITLNPFYVLNCL